ncbi:hypothetical protein ACO0K0_14875 [Undibacterium sp. SXout11W]|uniref:hypothetical protein n=1 Tax=Undibacterium sp. SXout11W TaxID=3413050 RepID=UPI003BF0C53E
MNAETLHSINDETIEKLARLIRKSRRIERLLKALLSRAFLWREEADRIAGASNSPDLVRQARDAGLRNLLLTTLTPIKSTDGRDTRAGQYSLSPEGRLVVLIALKESNKKEQA